MLEPLRDTDRPGLVAGIVAGAVLFLLNVGLVAWGAWVR